jgi:Kef-type K+ transport system membrane component KefB
MRPLPVLPIPIADLQVDTGSFFVIVIVAALAATTVATVPGRFVPPVVVQEIEHGIIVGPEMLGLAHDDEFVEFFSNLGLGMLFFFAGYEIDFDRIKGKPLRLGIWGWAASIVVAHVIAIGLVGLDWVDSAMYVGAAMATTAIGTLIPILRDAGELKSRFGTHLLAAGGAGEFGPVLLITLFLSTEKVWHEALILIAFVVLALVVALISVRLAPRGWGALERTFEASNQLAVRITVVMIFGLVFLAGELGLDVLLGGFVAGLIVRLALRGRELQIFESKLNAVGFGFFIPFFFVVSGIEYDIDALASLGAILKLLLFFSLFLVVRGLPALLFYRGTLALRDRGALAFYCATELPLVVAITTIAVEVGQMRSSTAAGLVGAAMLSTLVYPFAGLALRGALGKKGSGEEPGDGPPGGDPSPQPAPAG